MGKLHRWGTAAVAATAIGCASAAGPALGASANIAYSDSFTTPVPGAPTGRVLRELFTDPADPQNGKPAAVEHIHSQLPPGARYDTAAVPRCTAPDAVLMLQGPSACPAASKVGTNELVIDEGVPPTQDRYVTEQIAFFNEDHGLIIVSKDPTGAYVVVHGKIGVDTLDIELPPLPGTPPDGGADKSEHVIIYSLTGHRGGRAVGFINTPPSCPASGTWRFRTTFTYRSDGTKQAVESAMPCLRPGDHSARLHLALFHRQHARAGEPGRVRVLSSRVAAGRVTLSRQGHVVAHRKVTMKAGVNTLRLPAVAAGSYRLTVSGRVPGGKRVSRRARLVVR